MVASNRNAGRMNLCEARIAEECTFFMRLPDRSGIAAHGVGGEIKNISVTTGTKQNSMAEMPFEFSCNQIPGDNSSCFSVNKYHIQHFVARTHSNGSFSDLSC